MTDNIKNYQNVQILTADGVRLIVMLYDGVVRFNNCAQLAIEAGDIQGRNNNINRSLAIISELMNSLNMEHGGDVARKLESLYDFSMQQLTAANMKNDAAPLGVVNKIITELKGGWEAIASKKPAGEAHRSISHAG